MHGNVWEWVQDGRDPDYYANSPRVDPPGGAGSSRVIRGGAFDMPAGLLWSAYRGGKAPHVDWGSDVGVRPSQDSLTLLDQDLQDSQDEQDERILTS